MSKNKSFYNSGTLLLGAGLLAGYLIYRKSQEAKDASGTGSLGGTDDLLEQQGFDIDPNSIPDQTPDSTYTKETYVYDINPDGTIAPDNTTGGKGFSSDVPIASTGTGSLFQDAAATGGAIGSNIFLPSIAKTINKFVDTHTVANKIEKTAEKDTPFQKFIKDPYAINDLAVSKAEKTGSREVAELALDTTGKTVVRKTAQTTIKTVVNFIPVLDIPIGAALDKYFNRLETDPAKQITWGQALKANLAGEAAQLGVTAAATIPTAGIGTVPAFIAGVTLDVAATEGVYAAMGKPNLYGANEQSTPAPVATYNDSTGTYTNESGQKQSMASSSSQAQMAQQVSGALNLPVVANPFVNTSSGSSSSSNKTSTASTNKTSTAPSVAKTSTASTSSTAKTSTASTAPKVSVVSKISTAIKSTVSKIFKRK